MTAPSAPKLPRLEQSGQLTFENAVALLEALPSFQAGSVPVVLVGPPPDLPFVMRVGLPGDERRAPLTTSDAAAQGDHILLSVGELTPEFLSTVSELCQGGADGLPAPEAPPVTAVGPFEADNLKTPADPQQAPPQEPAPPQVAPPQPTLQAAAPQDELVEGATQAIRIPLFPEDGGVLPDAAVPKPDLPTPPQAAPQDELVEGATQAIRIPLFPEDGGVLPDAAVAQPALPTPQDVLVEGATQAILIPLFPEEGVVLPDAAGAQSALPTPQAVAPKEAAPLQVAPQPVASPPVTATPASPKRPVPKPAASPRAVPPAGAPQRATPQDFPAAVLPADDAAAQHDAGPTPAMPTPLVHVPEMAPPVTPAAHLAHDAPPGESTPMMPTPLVPIPAPVSRSAQAAPDPVPWQDLPVTPAPTHTAPAEGGGFDVDIESDAGFQDDVTVEPGKRLLPNLESLQGSPLNPLPDQVSPPTPAVTPAPLPEALFSPFDEAPAENPEGAHSLSGGQATAAPQAAVQRSNPEAPSKDKDARPPLTADARRVLLMDLLGEALKVSPLEPLRDALLYLVESLYPQMSKTGVLNLQPLHGLLLKQGVTEDQLISLLCFIRLCEPFLETSVQMPDEVVVKVVVTDYANHARLLGMMPQAAHDIVQAKRAPKVVVRAPTVVQVVAKPAKMGFRAVVLVASVMMSGSFLFGIYRVFNAAPPPTYESTLLSSEVRVEKARRSGVTIIVDVEPNGWKALPDEDKVKFISKSLDAAPPEIQKVLVMVNGKASAGRSSRTDAPWVLGGQPAAAPPAKKP